MRLDVTDASFGHRGQPVTVRDASIRADAGEIVAVIGTNGSGKSELVQGIAGLIPMVSGSVTVAGRPIDKLPAHRRARAGVALVPMGRRIFPELGVVENLRVAARDEARIAEALDRFPILAVRADQHAGALSGGEQQQLAIARALVTSPSVLLLDEPSAGLSPVMTERVFSQLDGLRGSMAIVVVEQVASLVLPLADRVYVMRGGRVVATAAPVELADPETLHGLYFGPEQRQENHAGL